MDRPASFQREADVPDIEGVARQDPVGLPDDDQVRKDFEALRSAIEAGGK